MACSPARKRTSYAEQAAWVLVVSGEDTYIVNPAEPGMTMTKTYSSSGSPEYTLQLDAVPGERLGDAATLQAFALAGACAVGDGLIGVDRRGRLVRRHG